MAYIRAEDMQLPAGEQVEDEDDPIEVNSALVSVLIEVLIAKGIITYEDLHKRLEEAENEPD